MAKVKVIKKDVRLTNYQIGDIIDISDKVAVEFLNLGVVEPVEQEAETSSISVKGGKVEKKKGK